MNLPDHDKFEGSDQDLEGDEPNSAVIGTTRGGEFDHLLHQELVVKDDLWGLVRRDLDTLKQFFVDATIDLDCIF